MATPSLANKSNTQKNELVQNTKTRGNASAAQGYSQGFTVCGVVTLIGGLIALLFLRPERERVGFASQASVRPALALV